ncbi:acyltransferase domain-containing protein [Streptomyces clavuligerus]|uniref:acyltransferase domain-containing protein n=1 Tax=Streptomyces clavuligerus TaxID=1901 RepID=UPI0022AC35CA|nr:acyltransferase domain-containing protein [Streptomyces clavuligerus]
MAVGLLDGCGVFAARMAECERALGPFVDWSLTEVVRGVSGVSSVDRVDVVQPVLWAVMVSLASVWRAYGVEPVAVVGHSQGEVAAAVGGGCAVAGGRGEGGGVAEPGAAGLTGRGGMLYVPLPPVEASVGSWLEGAVVGGGGQWPSSVTVSGDPEALDGLHACLADEGVLCWRVPGSTSPALAPDRRDP